MILFKYVLCPYLKFDWAYWVKLKYFLVEIAFGYICSFLFSSKCKFKIAVFLLNRIWRQYGCKCVATSMRHDSQTNHTSWHCDTTHNPTPLSCGLMLLTLMRFDTEVKSCTENTQTVLISGRCIVRPGVWRRWRQIFHDTTGHRWSVARKESRHEWRHLIQRKQLVQCIYNPIMQRMYWLSC